MAHLVTNTADLLIGTRIAAGLEGYTFLSARAAAALSRYTGPARAAVPGVIEAPAHHGRVLVRFALGTPQECEEWVPEARITFRPW
jgi:hypothetical protein